MARQVTVRGLLHPACGPVVRVEVFGPTPLQGVGVLDTGASISVIDRDLARALALSSPGAAEYGGVSSTGSRQSSALRRTRFGIHGDRQVFEIDAVEAGGLRQSVGGLDVVMLLGWDFLIACTLVCDGPAGAFELRLPRSRRAVRRRS